MKVRFLKAFHGDSVFLTFPGRSILPVHILIDGGPATTYMSSENGINKKGELYYLIEELRAAQQHIDLLVLTHVDDDHIGGLLKWLSSEPDGFKIIRKIWFNSGRSIQRYLGKPESDEYDIRLQSTDSSLETSIKQGVRFEEKIKAYPQIWDMSVVSTDNPTHFIGGAELTVLSPNKQGLEELLGKWLKNAPDSLETSSDKLWYRTISDLIKNDMIKREDSDPQNGSSIAFILTYLEGGDKKKLLFTADAHPGVLCESLIRLGYSETNPLNCELLKVPHHGSIFNNSFAFLKLISAKKYVMSADGSSHPHKMTIARLIHEKKNPAIAFNYPELFDEIFSNQDLQDFPYLQEMKNLSTNL